jgi:hypothetical protein
MRVPLALRLSREMCVRLLRRAASEGISPRTAAFARWVGNLIVEAIPGAVSEALHVEQLKETGDPWPEAGGRGSGPIPLAPGESTASRRNDGSDGAS